MDHVHIVKIIIRVKNAIGVITEENPTRSYSTIGQLIQRQQYFRAGKLVRDTSRVDVFTSPWPAMVKLNLMVSEVGKL